MGWGRVMLDKQGVMVGWGRVMLDRQFAPVKH